MKRTITKIIIHCSASPEGRDDRAADIARWHKQKGLKSIGYHYVIDLDGTIEEGRPLDKAGAHCEGANNCSIGICYIGGLDSNGNPKNTMTPEQNDALVMLLMTLRTQFPGIKIYGHNELNLNKACPCFDVRKWLANHGF
ncbi:MAG: N-acetylmuramoyl-L-alanine amidase [Paludibacteraceae bacterium]|nr:N-acetylmuramoyl-L-alanine amidase [Paludibacteraceae bacterium]